MALINKLKAIANAIRSKTNKTEELTLEQMASEVGNIYSPKAEEVRKVTIDENGTVIVSPSEGSDVMKEVEVTARVSGDGYDFTTIGYTKDESGEINSLNNEGIRVAKEILDTWNPQLISIPVEYRGRNDIVFFPVVDMSNMINANNAFQYCPNLRKIKMTMPKLTIMQNMCFRSGIEDVELTIPNGISLQGLAYYGNLKKVKINFLKKNENDKLTTSFNTLAYGCGRFTGEDFIINNNSEDVLVTDLYYAFRECFNLKAINFVIDLSELGSTGNPVQSTVTAFSNCQELQYVRIKNWGKYNLQFSQSTKLSAESIHYLIQNAMNVEDGAEEGRTLSLQATAKKNWQNSEYYEQDLAVLEEKGITIA